MFLKRAIFIYFLIALIFIVAIFVVNYNEDKDKWLQKLSKPEQNLYILEREASLGAGDLNITKAKLYYQLRQEYCQSLETGNKTKLCLKRTKPWWDNRYRRQSTTAPKSY